MWLLMLLGFSIVFIVLTTTRLKLHPFLALLLAAFGYGAFSGKMSLADVAASVNAGFGETIGAIGIVILAGSIIGTFLEKSGGAFTLAERTIGLVGQKNVPLAMGMIGYIVSIPVFCDSGFVILAPLAKAMSRRAGVPLAASAIALSLGLYATHTMVPPTPGSHRRRRDTEGRPGARDPLGHAGEPGRARGGVAVCPGRDAAHPRRPGRAGRGPGAGHSTTHTSPRFSSPSSRFCFPSS